jgi:transcriptional regulator of acetoin/glycerol metabolism
VLQEREVVPVGATRPVRVDFRAVAATHRNLDALVDEGVFRRDLLMRVDGFRHALPPLRERLEDVGLIVADLVVRRPGAAGLAFTSVAGRALLAHDWPGNVRELEQAIARGLALAGTRPLDVGNLGLARRSVVDEPALSAEDEALRAELVSALKRREGNVSDVARDMGKARMQIQRWIRRFGIDAEAYRRSK